MAQHLIGAPVFAQLHGGPTQIAMILLQLGFKTGKQGERVGRRTGKAGKDFVVVETPDFPGRMLNDAFSQRNLPVRRHYDLAVPADGNNGGRTNSWLIWRGFHCFLEDHGTISNYTAQNDAAGLREKAR